MSAYPNIKKIDVLEVVQRLEDSMNTKGYNTEYILDCIEYYFAQMIKNNLENKLLVQKIRKDILKIQHAKKESQAYIKQRLILEDLFFSLC